MFAEVSILHRSQRMISVVNTRDCNGISELPPIQPISPYKISCIKGSSEIPLISLGQAHAALISPATAACVAWTGIKYSGLTEMNVSQCFINLSPESEAAGHETRTCSSSSCPPVPSATNIIISHFWQFRMKTCHLYTCSFDFHSEMG